MSANINYNKNTGKHSFVTAKELAWHRQGTVVDNAMTSSEAIELAGLDYEVKRARVLAQFDEVDKARHNYEVGVVDDVYAIYRGDTLDIFGTVGSRYEIVQNKDAFKFIDSIIGEERAIFETAGALGKGETVFITCKLPYYIKINGHDTIENYLVISNGHDGKSSLNIFLTPIRIVCQNTLSLGREAAKFNIALRHTSSIHQKLSDASEILTISKEITEETQELYKYLTTIKTTDKQVKNYFNSLILKPEEIAVLAETGLSYGSLSDVSTRKKNILDDINRYYEIGVGQKDIKGTAFGAYNAVTGYLSNVKKYKNTTQKMTSLVMEGSDFRLSSRALDLALDLNS